MTSSSEIICSRAITWRFAWEKIEEGDWFDPVVVKAAEE